MGFMVFFYLPRPAPEFRKTNAYAKRGLLNTGKSMMGVSSKIKFVKSWMLRWRTSRVRKAQVRHVADLGSRLKANSARKCKDSAHE